ncbi:MAG: hypothetical protein IPQ08_06145 [Chitinophagaceae bacterium]|nr:hypothetical protein [Chitinophagaceae bacterium]
MSYSQYSAGASYQLVPSACIVDITPPTFTGISSLTASTDGSLTANWPLATDTTPPIEYIIFIALGSVSAGALFVNSNIVTIAPSGVISKKIFTLADQTTYLVNGLTYTVGVRAKDALGNINTNTVILMVVATGSGNLPVVFQTIATDLAATEILLAVIANGAAVVGGRSMTFSQLNTSMEITIDPQLIP